MVSFHSSKIISCALNMLLFVASTEVIHSINDNSLSDEILKITLKLSLLTEEFKEIKYLLKIPKNQVQFRDNLQEMLLLLLFFIFCIKLKFKCANIFSTFFHLAPSSGQEIDRWKPSDIQCETKETTHQMVSHY